MEDRPLNTRRILRYAIPLAVLALVVWLVHSVWRGYIEGFAPSRRETTGQAGDIEGGGGAFEGERYGHVVSEHVDILRKNEDGRPTVRILAERVLHYPDNRSRLVNPVIIHYTEAGETLALVGDEADILRKGKGGLELGDIRSGTLRGDVVLSHDRGTPEDSLDDFLVGLEELSFDNETDQMRTDGPVIMVGGEVSLTARRMLIVMDRETGRVGAMTFYEDILASLKVEDRLQMGLARMPGESADEAPAEETASAETAGAEEPAAASAAEPSSGDDEGPVLWRIDVAGDVDARQFDQRLTAPRVSLYSEMARPLAKPTPTPSPEGTAAEAPDESDSADGQRDAGAGEPQEAPGDADETDGAGVPLTVIADGPLIITPVGPAELAELGPRQHELTATGGRVTLRDGDLRVEGNEVVYNIRSGEGRIEGDEDGVALRQPGRLDLSGESLRFSRRDGSAIVSGPGRLEASLDGPGLIVGPDSGRGDALEGRSDGGNPASEAFKASWVRSMRLRFGRTDDLSGESLPEILRAEFHGNAVIEQQGGVLKGEDLAIDFHPRQSRRRDVSVPLWLTLAEEAEPSRGLVPLDIPAGTIVSWHVTPGAEVTEGDVLATLDVRGAGEALASPADGRIVRITRSAGSDVLPGDTVAVLETSGEQTVRRLVADGEVYLADTSREGTETPETEPLSRIGSIACRKLDVAFATEPDGGSIPKTLDAQGDVRVRDPEGGLEAEALHAKFARIEGGDVDVIWMEAEGEARVDRGETRAEGDYILRDVPGGRLILRGGPAVASRGMGAELRRIAGRRIAFLETEGRAEVRGKGELTVPAATDLRGRPRDTALPLTVHWSRGMTFQEERNFAQFDGNVAAHTGGSRLQADSLWVLFEEVAAQPSESDGEGPTAMPPEEDAAFAGSSELSRLLQGKAVQRVVTQGPTRVVEQEADAEGAVRFRLELMCRDLTFLEKDRKAYTREPGRLWVLAREQAPAGAEPAPGLPPAEAEAFWEGPAPEGYSRIGIAWDDSMALDETTYRAYFSGGVETDYIGRAVGPEGGIVGAGSVGGGRRSRVHLESGDLQVAFVEAPDEGAGAGPVDPQTLGVDRFVADNGVDLAVDDRRGTAHRVYYQREPELLRLFAGPGRDARLWREDESQQEFDTVVAREITYHPATGKVEVKGQKMISGATESGTP